jgi:predicted RNA-binding Zn ribbon-like protein
MTKTEGSQPFKWVGEWLCLDFNNTVDWDQLEASTGERLPDFSRLAAWSHEAGLLSPRTKKLLLSKAEARPTAARRALQEAWTLRQTIHAIFLAVSNRKQPATRALEELNRRLADVPAQVELASATPTFVWGWPARRDDLTAMLWPIAWSASQLLTAPALARVRTCASEDCGWMFIDSSRKHNRKWCEMGVCGNRAKARRFYERRKQRNRGGGSRQRSE